MEVIMADRINEVSLEATGLKFDSLSPLIREEFIKYYTHTDFPNMSEEDYHRNFIMISEEFDDWLSK
jgi:hypothetical protein